MDITVTFADSDVVLALTASPSMTVDEFKTHALTEAGYKAAEAILFYQDEQLEGTATLAASGVQENDIIMIARPTPETPGATADGSIGSRDRNAAIESARQQILYNPDLFRDISERMPKLADALHDQERFRAAYNEHYEQHDAVIQNPDSEEAQKRILELIQHQAVNENLANALEELPEAFAAVTMLYIDIGVNGEPIKAFVDSGAQQTIMSAECADRCKLSHLIDGRHQGEAVGVGRANILGRIHMAPIKVGGSFFACSFTILEGLSMDILLGLDMLRHHQACIDLKRSVLTMGTETVPFLSEADIPSHGLPGQRTSSVPASTRGQAPSAGQKTGSLNPFGKHASAAQSQPQRRSGSIFAGSSAGPSPSAASTGANGGPPPHPPAQPRQESNPPAQPRAESNPPSYGDSAQSSTEEAIQNITALGFSREQVVEALRQADGNPDVAASLLFGG